MTRSSCLFWVSVLLLVSGMPASAQDTTASDSTSWREWAWTPIVERDGVQFSYLFYRRADNQNNGVVVRLRNTNEGTVHYAFTILFRGPDGEAQARAEGTLKPGEMKTGEGDGLFWIPFRDGRAIGEVGLRDIRITPRRDDPT